jgi:thymidylate kinase
MGTLLVIEGVTGTGKSRTIAGLCDWGQRAGRVVLVVDEDVTLGSFLDDVNDPAWRKQPVFPGLDAGLAAAQRHLQAHPHALVVVERFHLSVYALFGQWPRLVDYDRALVQQRAVHVLLDYHPRLTEQRSILRPDRANWAADMDRNYGSRGAAIAAVERSQARRRRGLLLSELPYLHLDNRDGQWQTGVAAILAYCGLVATDPPSR